MIDLRNTVKIQNKEYPIQTSYKIWIGFQNIFKEDDTEKRNSLLIDFITRQNLPLISETIDVIIEFYINDENILKDCTKNIKIANQEEYFDFIKDFEYIYSAFLEQFNIDLIDTDLHWYKFKALFKSLNNDCLFNKIVHYRSVDLKSIPKEQRSFYKKMKELFSLHHKTHIQTAEDYHLSLIERVNKRYKEVSEMK